VKPGDVIDNKYRIEAQLGEGGMGIVLSATHLVLGSSVAIKVLKKDALAHPEVPIRFMREAKAASRLRNEHVVRVTDIGQLDSGEPYMVMEMLQGYDLATRLHKGALEPARAVEYIVQACEGLAEAHALGMVHRDVKPANLFVTQRSNGTPLVKVLDFGIATAAIDSVDHRLTTTQSVIGSPSYMSPEQLRATRDVDARSDVWSLGVTLYELLADRQPFSAPTITALSLKIVSDPHAPIAGIPRELMAILDRCLEKEREHRFANVGELAEALAPLFPNGKIAAELVSGTLGKPARAKSPEHTDPAEAGWRLPSAPAMTTTSFTAGESAAIKPRKRKRVWFGRAAAALAGGITTAAVIAMTRPTSTTPAASAAPPPAVPVQQPPAAQVQPPQPEPPPPQEAPPPVVIAPAVVETPKPATKPADKKTTKKSRPSKSKPAEVTSKPVEVTSKPVTRPDPDPDKVPVKEPPREQPKQSPPPPPPKKQPCLPSDKTCGL
jgi:serine/threonine-protein kinase